MINRMLCGLAVILLSACGGGGGGGASSSTPSSAGSSPEQFAQGQFDHAAFDKSKFGP